MPHAQGQTVTVGVTGASGAILAQKALALLEADARVARIHLVVTETGQRLFAEELGITAGDLKQLPTRILGKPAAKIEVLANKDVGASIASGSYEVDSMMVIPCSMGTLAAIANGISDDLVARAADVMLKEARKLVLCIRDTPFNRVHLENMLRAQQAGAVIMPAIPAFYHQPKTIDDLVTQYVCRVLAQIGLAAGKDVSLDGASRYERSKGMKRIHQQRAQSSQRRKRILLRVLCVLCGESFFSPMTTEPHSYRAGNDQVRALGVRAAVCADRSAAGGAGYASAAPRLADAAANSLDHCCDGRGAIGGHDHESHRRICATTARIRARSCGPWRPARFPSLSRGFLR